MQGGVWCVCIFGWRGGLLCPRFCFSIACHDSKETQTVRALCCAVLCPCPPAAHTHPHPGFDFSYRDSKEPLPDKLKPLLGECWPAFELLRKHALRPLPADQIPR